MAGSGKCCAYYPKYKLVKAFVTNDIEQNLVITKEEIDHCGCISDACVADEKTLPNPLFDLHVQVWNYHTAGTYAGEWVLCDGSLGMVIHIGPGGDIGIYTGGLQGSFRVVVLA